MYVDIRLAEIQAEYKREQLARLYGKKGRRAQAERGSNLLDAKVAWPALWARLPLLNR